MTHKERDKQIRIMLNKETPSYQKLQSLFFLMNIADRESLNAINQLLKTDSCELVRHEAAFALGEMASNDSVKILKETFQNDNSSIVKHECLMSLGTIGTKNEIDFLEEQTSKKEFEISCSAKIAIQRIKQTEDYEKLVKQNKADFIKKLKNYNSTNQNERIQILFQLMNIADNEALFAIYETLKNDPCRIVRHEAAFVLGEIGTKKAVKLLKKGIENEQTPIVIHEALFALGTTGQKEALEIIKKYENNKNYVILESAKIAIDRINLLNNPYSGKKEYQYLN